MAKLRVSAPIDAWVRTVLTAGEISAWDLVVDLDNWPQVRIQISAMRGKGMGKWGRATDLPEALCHVLLKLAAARDPEGWEAACQAEEAMEVSP